MSKWKYTNVTNELIIINEKREGKGKKLGHSTSTHDIKPCYNNSMAKTIQLAIF